MVVYRIVGNNLENSETTLNLSKNAEVQPSHTFLTTRFPYFIKPEYLCIESEDPESLELRRTNLNHKKKPARLATQAKTTVKISTIFRCAGKSKNKTKNRKSSSKFYSSVRFQAQQCFSLGTLLAPKPQRQE